MTISSIICPKCRYIIWYESYVEAIACCYCDEKFWVNEDSSMEWQITDGIGHFRHLEDSLKSSYKTPNQVAGL